MNSSAPTIRQSCNPALFAILLVAFLPVRDANADTLNVSLRVYTLESKGTEEPVWVPVGEPRKWAAKSNGFSEEHQAPKFPEIEQSFDFNEKFRLVTTKTLRGRIVISLYSGDTLLAHSQDNVLGGSCALSYTHTTGGGVLRFDILVWSHP